MSKRRVGFSGTEGLKQRTLCESAGLTHQLIHQELHDDHKKLPTRRLLSRRRRRSRSDPKKLARKGGIALPYAAVERATQRFAGPEEYAGFWLCNPRQKTIGMVEKLFLNWSGEPEYIRVRVGFFGFKRVLLPVQEVAVDEQRRILVLQ